MAGDVSGTGQGQSFWELGDGDTSKKSDVRRFIIFAHQRTGSTLLASRLNSHPAIRCYEEVLLPSVDSSPSLRDWLDARHLPQQFRIVPSLRSSFLESLPLAEDTSRAVGAMGVKVMYDQMAVWPRLAFLFPPASLYLRDPALRGWLVANQVLVIHLMRRNHLKTIVSQKLASQSGRFHSRNPPSPEMKVVVSLPGLKPRLRRMELAVRSARECVKGLPTMEIYYEDYVGGAREQCDAEICTALGQDLPSGGLSSPLQKLSTDDLRDSIVNYDAVVRHLSGTRFEAFLA